MAKLTIGRGTNPNDGTGDNLRDGANKVNLNFTEIYTAIGDGTTVDGTWKLQTIVLLKPLFQQTAKY